MRSTAAVRPVVCHAPMGSGYPFSSNGPTGRPTTYPSTSCHVAASRRTSPGPATACRRAAIVGTAPSAPSAAWPAATSRTPTTVVAEWMPARQQHGRSAQPRGPLAAGLDRGEPGAHRPDRVVLAGVGDAEKGHDAVTEDLRHVSPGLAHRAGHGLGHREQDIAEVFVVEPQRQPRGVDDVDEQGGDGTTLGLRFGCAARPPAVRAEAELVPVVMSACRARPHQRRAAPAAEPRPGGGRQATGGARHHGRTAVPQCRRRSLVTRSAPRSVASSTLPRPWSIRWPVPTHGSPAS